jgi:hypothetical protein
LILDLEYSLLYLGIIVIIIGLISIKAEKIIAPSARGRFPLSFLTTRIYRLKRGTLVFGAYIVIEILVGLTCIVSGIYLIFFKKLKVKNTMVSQINGCY